MFRHAAALFLGLILGSPCAADDLPLVKVPWELLRDQAQTVLARMDHLQMPWPAATRQELMPLLAKAAGGTAEGRRVQELLDAQCLVGVHVNPESRVKAQRGPAAAALWQGGWTVALVKVYNEAGVTAPLRVTFSQADHGREGEANGWLTAEVYHEPHRATGLAGGAVEYVLLRLASRDAGRREATFQFDVGQGTQDLGFRAEVPILFTARPAVSVRLPGAEAGLREEAITFRLQDVRGWSYPAFRRPPDEAAPAVLRRAPGATLALPPGSYRMAVLGPGGQPVRTILLQVPDEGQPLPGPNLPRPPPSGPEPK